ncbi:NAD(P)-dependent alcohol dehydrogenase [Tomitella cavernea]|nr:NAD(P)-dependent alcohol dehydrogenase [Tomitella cavernea]
MRALQITGPGRLEWREVPVPAPAVGQLLVRVAAAGVCHSDLHVLHADRQRPAPMTLGHEIAGTVAAAGDAVSPIPVGTAGVVYLCWSCGSCRECTAGRQNLCLAAGRSAMPPCPGLMGHDGGMAEYVAVPASAFVPTDIAPVQAAPLADAALTSYHAINGTREHLRPGGTAVVIGVGGLGHIAVQILRAVSPARVVAVDLAQDKLDTATRLGADVALAADDTAAETILRLTGGRGADAVFDFVGVDATAQLAVRTVAPGGAYRMVGLGGGAPGIAADGALGDAWPWGASIRKSYAGTRNDLVDSLALAASGAIRADIETFPLAEGPAVFARLERGEILGRAVLIP